MKDLLIVEDDPTLGEGIRLALQAPELRPQLCRSLADAGELLSRRSFDLLILDINLPDGMAWTSSAPSGGRVRFP